MMREPLCRPQLVLLTMKRDFVSSTFSPSSTEKKLPTSNQAFAREAHVSAVALSHLPRASASIADRPDSVSLKSSVSAPLTARDSFDDDYYDDDGDDDDDGFDAAGLVACVIFPPFCFA
jgi:hypothetical protein